MAISQMGKLTILAPNQYIDELLAQVQGLQQMQVIDLNDVRNKINLTDEVHDVIEAYVDDVDLDQVDRSVMAELDERKYEIERAIELVENYVPKPSFMERMRKGKPKVSFRQIEFHGQAFEEAEIVERVKYLTSQIDVLEERIESYREKYDELSPWRKLEITPNELRRFSFVRGVIGRIPSTNEDQFFHFIKENDELEYEMVFVDENDYGIIVFLKDPENRELLQELREYQFVPLNYSSNKLPKELLDEYDEVIEQSKESRKLILAELKDSQELLDELKLQYEYVSNLSEREQAKVMVARSNHLMVIQGWIEKENEDRFIHDLQNRFGEELVIRKTDIREDEQDEIPTKLKNNWLVRPFETLVTMYGTPHYNEVDPTPYVMPFFTVFFGMMLADLGYGLILFIATLIPMLFFNFDEGNYENVKLVNILSWSVMLWGAIYGSFFGYTIEWMQLIDLQNQVIEVLGISVAIGLVHMAIAFALNVYLQHKRGNNAIAVAEGVVWIAVIFAIVLAVLGMAFESLSFLLTLAGWIGAISMIAMVIAYIVEAGSIAGLGNGLLGLINGVSYFGDIISYARLMALGLSGLSIGAAFNLIVSELPGVARFTLGVLIFIALHLFNMFLSVLTGAVHSLRLIFVEFFGKFYTGNGKPFKPLQVEEKYVEIQNHEIMED